MSGSHDRSTHIDETATEQTTDTGSEPTPTGASLETVG
jgi:hypothetical protein